MRKSGQPRTYRRYSAEEKRRIVAEAAQPGTSVASVARRHGMNDNVIFNWRKRLRDGEVRLMPVVVTPEVPSKVTKAGTARPQAAGRESLIEICTARGHVVRIGAGADITMVQSILKMLGA
ncbi:MAG TPA: transposase [Lacipirellulaceae bacterium]|nr:transposase [Lacipirellulaceae bacterium]